MQTERMKPEEVTRFRMLTQISQQITSVLDIDELLVQIVRLIQRTFNYYHVGIGLIEGDEVVYRVGAGVLWDDPDFQFKPNRLKVGSEGLTGWVAYTGEPALIPDATRDPRFVWMEGSDTRSELIVPINVKGRTIGVLDLQSQYLSTFDLTDQELMQAIANQAGIAIENAHLFAETQRLLRETEGRARKLTTMNSIQQGLASKLDVQSIYELVGDKFHDLFDAQVVLISTYDQQSDTVEHHYAVERGVRIPWPGKHPPGGFRSQIIQTRQPLLLNTDVAEKSIRLGQPVFPDTDMPKSWLGVPMFEGHRVTGILSVQNLDRENAFDESDIRLLQMFAASMSIALENARLYEESRQHAVLIERQRLAKELHDSVTQSLYGITLYAQAAAGNIRVGQVELAGQYLEDIQNTAQESLADMRLLIYELKPPILEKEGLVAALQNRLTSVEDRVCIKSSIQTNLTQRLSTQIEEGLYQITREALNNIIKHAHAKNILIRLQNELCFILMEIIDDGIGFELGTIRSSGCLGIASMQECAQSHGWQLEIKSNPGNGTRIKVEVGIP
jgi:signal transduction histidine kinase